MNKSTFSSQIILSLLVLSMSACQQSSSDQRNNNPTKLPPVEREFRAAWVASVANINWPSDTGLSRRQQQAEAIALLDMLQSHHFNAVIFQVRPQCDALYPSPLEPWSYYLSGQQGENPGYDPLAFWIGEAHKRGIELHAWLNPYRAHHPLGGPISSQSIIKKYPELVVELAQGYHWLIPTEKGTQDHSYEVVMDLVKRYDLDGIHFDDYFYPYPSYHNDQDFPDEASWKSYQRSGGNLSKSDWRRAAVDQFIKRVYDGIKSEKDHVKFGLSPFGIWRPGNPPSIAGFDQHEKLYADAKKWLNEGWIDYYSPQLYWPINQIPQSFPVLLGWWEQENILGRHLWPGISIGRLSGEKAIDETINQIMITRGMLPESPGIVHWSIGPLMQSPELRTAIKEGPYRKQALIPETSWLKLEKLETPNIQYQRKGEQVEIVLSPTSTTAFTNWVLYYKYKDDWSYQIQSSQQNRLALASIQVDSILQNQANDTLEASYDVVYKPLDSIAVQVVDRTGSLSTPKMLRISN